MIYFFSDNHYGTFPGRELYQHLPAPWQEKITFFCDEWEVLESGTWEKDCSLLILNMIGGTCSQPHPGPGAERAVKAYLERGGSLLLLHGSSAAFWQWNWWRRIVGLRWVRPGDPDGVVPSTHPTAPCIVTVAKVRHELAARLAPFELPADEIYTDLEQMGPVTILMETVVNGRTYPQCYECATPQGGKIIGFIPGHQPECVQKTVDNAVVIMEYLLKK